MGLSRIATAIAGLLVVQPAPDDRRATVATVAAADAPALYAAVRENLARAQRVAHEFSYEEPRTSVHTNPFGRIGTGAIELYEVYPSPDPQLIYRRLIARNGVPLSPGSPPNRIVRIEPRGPRRGERQRDGADARRREQDKADARRRAQALIEDVVGARCSTQLPVPVSVKAGSPSGGRRSARRALIARLNEGTLGSLTRGPRRWPLDADQCALERNRARRPVPPQIDGRARGRMVRLAARASRQPAPTDHCCECVSGMTRLLNLCSM